MDTEFKRLIKGYSVRIKEVIKAGCGEPMVLIHGALSDMNVWSEHLERLSKNFNVIALTLPGFEEGEATHCFNIDVHAKAVNEFIQNEGLRNVKLIGWSYGADVALACAIESPELFDGVMLYEPGYPGVLDDELLEDYFSNAVPIFSNVQHLVDTNQLNDAAIALIDGVAGFKGYFHLQSENYRRQQLSKAKTLKRQLSQTPSNIINKSRIKEAASFIKVGYGALTSPLFKLVSNATAIKTETPVMVLPDEHHFWPLELPEAFCKWIESNFLSQEPASS